jgi:hypothetical protein
MPPPRPSLRGHSAVPSGPAEPGSPPRPEGEGKLKKGPRWTIAFLRALERTGNARAAAEDAGIDHSTAYARRKVHEEFADAWDAAVYRYAVAKEAREAEEIARLKKAPPPHFVRSPSPAKAGEDVFADGQVKRAGRGRWSKAKEAIFFEELAATANASRAAAAVGMSKNAVLQRRLRHPVFAVWVRCEAPAG